MNNTLDVTTVIPKSLNSVLCAAVGDFRKHSIVTVMLSNEEADTPQNSAGSGLTLRAMAASGSCRSQATTVSAPARAASTANNPDPACFRATLIKAGSGSQRVDTRCSAGLVTHLVSLVSEPC